MAAFAGIYWMVSMLELKINLKSIFFVICFLSFFSCINLRFGIWSLGGMTILLIAASLWITPQVELYFVENHKETMELQKKLESRTNNHCG